MKLPGEDRAARAERRLKYAEQKIATLEGEVAYLRRNQRPMTSQVRRMSDGKLSIVVNDSDECVCPEGLPGTDLACLAHEGQEA